MATPIQLNVNQALIFAQTSANPIQIADTGNNIAINADALVQLGVQLVSILDTDVNWTTDVNGNPIIVPATIDNSISITDLLALAPKTNGIYLSTTNPTVFTQVTGSLQDLISNQAALALLGPQFGGYTLSNGSHFQASFTTASHLLASITMNASNAASSSVNAILTTLKVPLYVKDTGANLVANADTLVKLGTQLTAISLTDYSSYISSPISLADFLALAPKTINTYWNVPAVFQKVNSSLQDFINNETALSSLGSQLGSYILPDGTQFQATFTSSGHLVTAITMDVANALSLTTSSILTSLKAPLYIIDTRAHIVDHIEDLVKLGIQLAGIQISDDYGFGYGYGINSPISVKDFLALAAKTTDYNKHPEVFGTVTGSLQDFVNNEAAIAALGKRMGGYTLPDSTHFQVTFANNDHSVASITMDATSATNSSASLIATTLNAPISVTDTSANIAAHADGLAKLGTQLASIQVSDSNSINNPISLVDFLIIATNLNRFGHATVFNQVTGSLQEFINNQSALAAVNNQLGGFTLPDSTHFQVAFAIGTHTVTSITMDAINAASPSATLIAKTLGSPISIVDTAANIAANADTLVKLGATLSTIKMTDNSINTPISFSDFLALASKTTDSSGQPAIFNQVIISLHDFVVNSSTLVAFSKQLAGFVTPYGTHFQVKFANHSVTSISTNATDIEFHSASLSLFSTTLGVPLSVNDTQANIAKYADALTKLGSQLIAIQVTDDYGYAFGYGFNTPVSLSNFLMLAAKTTDKTNIPEVFTNVTGTLSDFVTNEKALAQLSKQLAGYTLPDGTHFQTTFASNNHSVTLITADVGNLVTHFTTLSLLAITLGAPLLISDSGAQITSYVNDLIKWKTTLTGIQINDDYGNGTNNAISLANFLSIAGITTNSFNNPAIFNIVTGTVQDFINNVDMLANLSSQLGATQLTGAFNTINSPVSLADFLAIAAKTNINEHLAVFNQVTGSLQDLINNKAALAQLGQQFGGYTLPDGTHFQIVYNSDQSIASISMDVTNAIKSAALVANTLGTPITISDYAGNMISNMDLLEANINSINSITFNDVHTPTLLLTSHQWLYDSDVLNKFTSPYQLTLTSVKASVLSSVLANTHVNFPVNILDGALRIVSVLDTLQANLNKINTITLSNSSVDPVLILDALQYHADQSALAKISSDGNQYRLYLTGENTAQIQSDLKDSHVNQVSLLDSAINISSNLDGLLAMNAQLGTITLTDTGIPNLILSASQYWQDNAVLGKIISPYQLTLNNEIAARVINDSGNTHISVINITDNAAHVIKYITDLESVNSLASIVFSDPSTPTLTLNVNQINQGLSILNAIQSLYQLSVNDNVSSLNNFDFSKINAIASIEVKPQQLDANLKIDHYITTLNLSSLNLQGDTLNEMVYAQNGTEIDILNQDKVIEQLVFTQNNETQLHIIGVATSAIHLV